MPQERPLLSAVDLPDFNISDPYRQTAGDDSAHEGAPGWGPSPASSLLQPLPSGHVAAAMIAAACLSAAHVELHCLLIPF